MNPPFDQLSNTLRLVEASRAAFARIPARPGVDRSQIMHRMGAAANELGHLHDALLIDSELRVHALFPVMMPATPEHISEFLSTRAPTLMQQDDADAELVGSSGADTRSEVVHEHIAQLKRLQEVFNVSAKEALERMTKVSALAQRTIAGDTS